LFICCDKQERSHLTTKVNISSLGMEHIIQPNWCQPSTALYLKRCSSLASYHRLTPPVPEAYAVLFMLSFSWCLPAEAEKSYRVEFLNARRFVSSAEGGKNLFSLVPMRSVYCACLCLPAGRANRSLVLGVSSAVTHLIL
jgi:hypothetical protein